MEIIIDSVPPFDFDLSSKIFSYGDRRIRKYEGERFWQALRFEDHLVLIIVRSLGSVDKPKLSIELKSGYTDDIKIDTARENVRSIFNLDLDLKLFYKDVKGDKTMSGIIERLKGLKSPATPTVFEALIDSIIEQQISLEVAHGLQRDLIIKFGDPLEVDGEVFYSYPRPQRLAYASLGQLRKCGLSMRKAEYINSISKSIASNELDLEKFNDFESTEKIIDELDKIRGIGLWTAELTVLRGMHRFDAIPADDLGLRRSISHYYFSDAEISSKEARVTASKWGKWKGLAGFYLTVAERLGVGV